MCAAHGALTGWDRWWFAVVGYRTGQRSVLEGAQFERIGLVWDMLTPALWALVAVLCAGLVTGLAGSARARRTVVVLGSWSLLALVAFMLGGQFFRHYWTILAFPAATVAGVTVASIGSRQLRWGLAGAVLLGPLMMTVEAIRLPRDEVGVALHEDTRLLPSEQVADWFGATAGPGDRLYVMCASAAVYGNGDIDPPYPYLWFDGVRQVPGAQQRLVELLSGPDRPRFVAMFQRIEVCGPSGELARELREHYVRRATSSPISIYESVVRPDG
jgi:hypothetical protein